MIVHDVNSAHTLDFGGKALRRMTKKVTNLTITLLGKHLYGRFNQWLDNTLQ